LDERFTAENAPPEDAEGASGLFGIAELGEVVDAHAKEKHAEKNVPPAPVFILGSSEKQVSQASKHHD
jgi:hypothetical protein